MQILRLNVRFLLSLNLQEEVECVMELIEGAIRDNMEDYVR